jgi:ParB family transcriptional regulator, chromosome partitioning protein
VLAVYREPLGGHALLFVALPIEQVAPTPFQRDISDAHVRKLTVAMDKTRRFLDPVIAVREERAADGARAGETSPHRYWVPNGFHRLTALKELGARTLLALLVPEPQVAYQILALNIEKAHNLRERSLGVVRMYRDLVGLGRGREKEPGFALEFEEPSLVTLGFAYQGRPRLSGGAYYPVLRKVDAWLSESLDRALVHREERAAGLLALDDAVSDAVARLKERGFQSPYLKAFVVARVNPLRFMKGEAPPVDELLRSMAKKALGINAGKIKAEDIARSGGALEGSE